MEFCGRLQNYQLTKDKIFSWMWWVPELDRPVFDFWYFEKERRLMMDWWPLEVRGDLKPDVADRQINYTNLF